MLVSVLPVPFADAGRQRQYEAVRAALEAETDAPTTVLLGNLGAFSNFEADILLVRPGTLALAVLTPRAGQLTLAALTHGNWQLDGQPLLGRGAAANPFVQYQQQLPAAVAWLDEQLGRPVAELLPCVGVALFEAPLTFGAGVEAQLHQQAVDLDFQLVGGAAQLPARLRPQASSEAPILSDDELLDWADLLLDEFAEASQQAAAPLAFLTHKLHQLWRWLGAEDIPADPPYGTPPPADQHRRDQQEQARLHQLRQELQAELHQQRQEAAAREAVRTQELTQLGQQLAQAGPSPTARAAEQRAKEALEEALRTARTELATRNAELDSRIQQLGQLIGLLQAEPGTLATTTAALPTSAGPVGAGATSPTAAPTPQLATAPRRSFRRLRQAERWGLVALGLAGAGAATWGFVHWAQHPAPRPAAAVAQRARPDASDEYTEENQPAAQDELADSLARLQASAIDTPATRSVAPEPAPASNEFEPASMDENAITPEASTPKTTPASTDSPAPTVPATTEPTSASPTPAASETSPAP